MKTIEQVTINRLVAGEELQNGEVFINYRPHPTDSSKVIVRLFNAHDQIVTRVWNANATIEREYYTL